ncbi:hypothetical protein IV203_005139 [Nitzschia inconspicua]|uniref:Uncharacterized protein n=1 Tax=Nitzschia inconspicua TaxID=303405 RepID=A0A9K3KMI1_9STRA|nr:hypothetical protein IV203_005139 [Nitzschia inconspicua]
MQSTRIVMGRGNVSTSHGQIKILKHSTPDLVTYIQRAVKSGVYRSKEEIEQMNKSLKENPTDLRRIRWNVQRGSKIVDYPKEYEILTLNPPPPFQPRMPVKDQKKMFNKYIREERPMDRLVNGYLNKEASSKKNSDGISADDYYRRLLGFNKGADTAMGSKSATLAKAYAVAVKQYHVMRTQNLSEKEALEKVEELLAQEEFREKTHSRTTAETLRSSNITMEEQPIDRAEKAFPGTKSKDQLLTKMAASRNSEEKIATDDGNLALLYSDNQRSFEGMITWTKRLQAVPYRQWTVGASTALDHWIAKRVLGLSEETWLALLEGDSPELMGRGRDIVMARHALFPETILDAATDASEMDGDESDNSMDKDEELESLLSSLSDWNDGKGSDKMFSSFSSYDTSSFGDVLIDELQAWRQQNIELPYDDWSEGKKKEFMTWLQSFVTALLPDSSLGSVNLEETRRNLLASPPLTRESANEFWDSIRDDTSAELFLQKLLEEKPDNSDHPFWDLEYSTQLERLVNLGSIREIANEYASEADRSKFLTRYGHYLLEGVKFDHLIVDPTGSIMGSDLGQQLQEKYKIGRTDRFSLRKIQYGDDGFGSEASERARSLYRAWNKLKAGRANYEEKLFQSKRLGLKYDKDEK